MWGTIQRAREERIEKATPVLCGSLIGVPGVKFIPNPACAAYDKVGDTTIVIHNARVDDHGAGRANNKNGDNFVPLQFKPFIGEYSRYAISPEFASKKIERVDLLLDTLNGMFDTNIPISYPGIRKTLRYLINKGHDLGVVYAHLQVIWPKRGVPSISSNGPCTDDTNSDYIIGSPQLAARKCQDINELLSFLNMSFDTDVTLSMLGVKEVLRFLVDGGYKFGDICAHVHNTWPSKPKLERQWLKPWKCVQMRLKFWEDYRFLERRGEHYEDQRQSSLRDDAIHDLYKIQPRRIWDLYAHRVIPFQFSSVDANHIQFYLSSGPFVPVRSYLRLGPTRLERYHPISHSWTEDMSPVDSPVNAHEWLIPLPHGVTLEAVRNELLNLGAQYVWLDVVC